MVTIKEIAKECGLSAMAVSKALRDEKDISPKTKERVKEVAKQMGYTRNTAAASLKTRRSYMLGVLFAHGPEGGVTHELFATILNEFIHATKNAGYTITFIGDTLGKNKVSYLEYVRTYGCDGVLIITAEFDDDGIIELMKSDVPVVTIDYIYNGCGTVMSDNNQGIESMIDYAVSMGHSKIAMIHGEITSVTKKRIASFHRSIEKHQLNIPDSYLQSGIYHSPESAEEITHRLLGLKIPPTFIIYQDDFAMIGGMNAIEKEGLSYPENISIAGYDGMLITQVMRPRLMTWQQNSKQMGFESAKLLIDAVENPKCFTPTTVTVEGKLLKGQSVKNLNE